MRRIDKRLGGRLLWPVVVAGALAAWLAPAASAAPGDQLWKRTWPSPIPSGYEIRSASVLVRGPGGDLWVANTGMDGATRDRDYVLLRYAPSGVLRWALETGSANQGHEYVSDVAVGHDRSAVLTGTITSGVVWTVKVSPLGKRVWARRLASAVAGGEALGAAVALDSHGSVYVLGARDRSGRGQDVVLVKYSPKGVLRWTRYLSAGGSGDDAGVDIVIDGGDRVFITGTVQTLHKGKDVLIARFTTAGTVVWKRVWGSGGARDDGAHDLAVSKAGVAVAGNSILSTGVNRGIVLKAKRTTRSSDKLGYHISVVPGLDLGWASVAINAAGDVAAGGTATAGFSTSEFAFAKWPANGSPPTFEYYTPLSGHAGCDEVWLTANGTLLAAGRLNTGATAGVHLVSRAPAPHGWVRTTTDYGWCTSLVASADGICLAGYVGEQVALWMYEP